VSCKYDHGVLVSTSIVVAFCSDLLLSHTSMMIGFLTFVSEDGDGNMLHYLVEFLLTLCLGLVLGGEFI